MIDLVSKRFIFLAISLLIIIPGLIAILAGGLKPGIDFTGGVRLTVKPLNDQASGTELFKQALAKAGYGDSLVKSGTIGTAPNITNTMLMDIPRIAGLPDEQREAERSKVAQELVAAKLVAGSQFTTTVNTTAPIITPVAGVTATVTVTAGNVLTPAATITGTTSITGSASISATGTTTGTTGTTGGQSAGKTVTRWRLDPAAVIDDYTVGPTVGNELLGRAVYAILAASAAILIYLTVVFRRIPNAFRYGICAIAALLHDVLVVLGIFAILGFLFGVEIDALFITALLTVIGFSVHDTIVVFDRVRENIVRRRFESFSDVVNYSLVQTLARSINTSITVLLTLFALYLFGGASIRGFVLALLIGIMSGTYSSIFNASMLLVIWENREWNRGSRGGTPAATTRATATR